MTKYSSLETFSESMTRSCTELGYSILALFSNPRLASWFGQRYETKRPVRFGMYTSRTPYPGMMSVDKNSKQLLPLLDYYLTLAQEQPEQTRELKARGRWPELDLETLR